MNTKGETMNPTEADYEKLARTLCLAQWTNPDATVKTLHSECREWELHGIDADSDEVSTTRDTLDDFRRNSKTWNEAGKREEINGGLYWDSCQAIKGQRRCELCVVDCGDFRIIFQN